MNNLWQSIQKAVRLIPFQIGLLALFFCVYHLFLFYCMRETAVNLGAVRYRTHIVPLYAEPSFDLSLWVLPAIVVCVGFLYLCHKYLLSGVSVRRLIWIAVICFVAINVSVALIDGYREIEKEGETNRVLGLLEPYTRTSLEYYGDVPRVDELGLRAFLRDYSKPELFDTLSGHTRTHPPGGVLFLWFFSKIFGYNLVSASLISIIFTALAVIPIYYLGERLYGTKVARYALLLFLITPNFVMFTGTSMDGPFSVFPILSVYLFYEARAREVLPDQTWHEFRPYSLLTGLSLALGMFMTYSTVVVGVFLCIIPLLERKRFVQYLKVLLFAAAGFVGFYLLLFVLTGFRPIEALVAAIAKDEMGMGTGYESLSRYLHLSFANLFAFLIGVGLPITTVWLRQVVSAITEWRREALSSVQERYDPRTPWILRHEKLDGFVIGFLITLLFFTFSTLFTMEVERIWIFMVPFFVIPVAKHLVDRSLSDLYWVGGILTVQLIVGEVLLYTYW
ncbi:glycosyltransferase family 39 protein [Candidatus Poribacteria bacterium]|nr:glycosyltransferase family 39 protein [Candidatus Poribacteria bacterium]MXY29138.1 glycosyltransferase family 39 protein [Candidatus Poribacteria bacterium]